MKYREGESFPVMPDGKQQQRVLITWAAAEEAYKSYKVKFDSSQSLKRIAERGGFGYYEMDMFYPEWRTHIIKPINQ